MKIVFALLAHGSVALVSRVIRTIALSGHGIVVHYDAKVPEAKFAELRRAVDDIDRVRFAPRVKVGWGEWSVVEATLNCLDTIEEAGWEPDYVYLMSGADYPIRAATQLEQFLDRNKGDEFIESVPSESVKWVKSGPQRERYQYRWYFNWRENPRLTENLFSWQKALGLKRRFVREMSPHLGSQWWVLTWPTLKQIMRLAREPDIRAFFRTTLIADELFFQTLVRQFVPDHRIIGCPLTLYQFSDYGYPVVYYEDHLDYLVRQRFFMARKLTTNGMTLRAKLDPYWTGEKTAPTFIDEDVGIVGTEYEDWRFAHREGPPNQPLVASAGARWSPSPRRTSKPLVAVLGTSTTELCFVNRILRQNPDVRVHGQLFHPTDIEFADGAMEFASYDSKDVEIRDVSPVDFLVDVVRAEPVRTTAFMLRWTQGGQIADALMKRPNARLVILGGDPLVSFSENALGTHPLLDQPLDLAAAHAVPPAAAANRFRIFLKDYGGQLEFIDQRLAAASASRPKGWVSRFDPVRIGPEWLKRLEGVVGVKLAITPEAFEAERAAAVREFDLRRSLAVDLLVRGGIDPIIFDVLRQESGNPANALTLV